MAVFRSCLLWLLVYLALAGGVAFAVERRIEQRKPALIAGAIAGFILFLGVVRLVNAGRKVREVLLIRAGQQEAEPQDGKTFVAIGAVSAIGGQRLVSPLTRVPCVAYAYKIIRSSTQKWEGEALVPCSIRSGVHSIRLLGLTKIDFKPEILWGDAVIQNAAQHIRSSDFQTVERDDGTVRRDRGTKMENPILKHALFSEQVVRQGDEICVIGKYSTARSGLLVERLERADGLIFPRIRAIGGGLMNFAGFTAVVAAAFAVFFALVPLDERQPSTIEMRIEDLLDARIRQPVVRAGLLPLPLTPLGDGLEPFEARGVFRTARGETSVSKTMARRVDHRIEISFFNGEQRVAFITVTEAGELTRVHVAGEDLPVPPESFTFHKRSEDEIAGRLTWARRDVPAVHVLFRTMVAR